MFRKTIKHLKQQGLIITIIKIFDYISFKKNLKRKHSFNPTVLNDSFLKIITNPKGINVFYKDINLTKNIGFHSAIRNLERWHDSTQSECTFEKKSDSFIIANISLWNLPIKQIWNISIENNKINWDILLDVENIVFLEELKFGVIIDPHYDILEVNSKENFLPDIHKEWQAIELLKESNVILKNKNDNGIYPAFKFYFQGHSIDFNTIVQNMDAYSAARLLQIVSTQEIEYGYGKYKIATMTFEFIQE